MQEPISMSSCQSCLNLQDENEVVQTAGRPSNFSVNVAKNRVSIHRVAFGFWRLWSITSKVLFKRICSSDWQMLLEERLVKGQQSCVYESTSITHCIKWLHGDQWVPNGNLVTLTVQWICINLYIYVACTLQGFENDNWTNGAEPPKSEYNFVYRLPGLLQLWLESRETNENLFPEPAVSWNNFCFILNA